MGTFKVGDKVKVVRADLDIFGKTAVVTDAALLKSDFVLIVLDKPDTTDIGQLGRLSLREGWLSRIVEEEVK